MCTGENGDDVSAKNTLCIFMSAQHSFIFPFPMLEKVLQGLLMS